MTGTKMSFFTLKLLTICLMLSSIQMNILSDVEDGIYKLSPRALQTPNPSPTSSEPKYDSFIDNYYVYTYMGFKVVNLIIVIYIFIIMCATWYNQIAKPKIFMFVIGMFTGRKIVDVVFAIAYMHQYYIHPTVWFIVSIITFILVGICCKFNQSFGYAAMGFSSLVGLFWFVQLILQLFGVHLTAVYSIVFYGVGFLGAFIGVLMILRSKGRPQSLLGRNILMVFAGAYAFSWLIGQILVFFIHTMAPYYICVILYVVYLITTFLCIFGCLKRQKI